MSLPTVLTVLTVARVGFARDALSLMIRVPARPSRPKLISIPSARRGVCARRSRAAIGLVKRRAVLGGLFDPVESASRRPSRAFICLLFWPLTIDSKRA
jgi:hypothetical protein